MSQRMRTPPTRRRWRGLLWCGAAVILPLLVACSSGKAAPPRWSGVAYPQSVDEPSLRLAATTKSRFELPEDADGRAVVLLFGTLRSPQAATFLHALGAAANELSSSQRERLMLVFATTDAAHDRMTDLVRALKPIGDTGIDAVGVRGTFALTEVAARSVQVDVEPPDAAGRYQIFGPQAVGFGSSGQSKVAWNLTASQDDLEHDLAQLAHR